MIKKLSLIMAAISCHLFIYSAVAQNATISGKISDGKNGEEIIGATIRVKGTAYGAISDVNGNYLIKGIKPATYDIEVSYAGYKAQSKKDILLKPSESKVLSFSILPDTKELKEVVIAAKVDRQTASGLLLQQKNLASISDGISSEAIKRSPDRTTGDALKRVSGVTVQDNKFVVVRGLADRYNIALINGVDLPTTEPDKKAFSFDIIPSALIDNLVIYKTASPELRADFGGGAVYVTTKDIPEKRIFNINISTQYNSLTTFKPYKDYNGGSLDFIGLDDGTRALPKGLPSVEDNSKPVNQTTLKQVEHTKLFKNNWGVNENASQTPGYAMQLMFGNNFKVFNKESGIIASVSLNNTPKTYMMQRYTYEGSDLRPFRSYDDQSSEKNYLTGIMLNMATKLNSNNKLSFKNILNINGEDLLIDRHGTQNDAGVLLYEKASARQFTTNTFYSGQLKLENYIPSLKLKSNVTLSQNNISREMPDQKRLLYTSSNDTNFSVAIPFGSPNPISSGITSNKLSEDGNVIAIDLSRQFKLMNIRPTVKVGFYNSTKNRTFNSRAFGWSTGKFNPDLDILPPNAIFNDSNISKDRYFLSEITGGQDKYTAKSLLRAYYISFDHYLFKRFRLNYGLRYESFNQQLTAFNPQIGVKRLYNSTYENFFPIANITYNITEKTNLRFSYSQTTVRPEFREIAPFTFYDFINNSLTVGDTALKPINIKNYDLRFEYYPSGGQVFTLTYFYKTFNNAIENTFEYGSGNRLRTFKNIKDVKCQGVELEFRVNPGIALSFPEKHWSRYLTFSCNSSIIESEADLSNLGVSSGSDTKRPLQGQSGYSINGGLLIMPPSNKWSLNVLYNRIGRRIGDVGGRKELHIWEVPRDLIDAQVSYTFNKNVTLKLTASDLLNQYYMMYSDLDGNGTYNEVKDIVVNKAKFGTTFTFAIGITL